MKSSFFDYSNEVAETCIVCKHPAKVVMGNSHSPSYRVACTHCTTSTNFYPSEKLAIQVWNSIMDLKGGNR